MAAEQTLRAPYASSSIVNQRCDDCTTNTVTPDAQTGRVDALSEVVRAPLDNAGGLGVTNGAITASTTLPTATKSVDATATISLSDVAATLFGATHDSANLARVKIRVTLTVTCGGCPGGSRFQQKEVIVADTDPATLEPGSAAGTLTISLPRLQLHNKEKMSGPATVMIEAQTLAMVQSYCSCTLTTGRAARARSDVTVASIRLVTA
jgi:hypothetical protein